MSDSSRPAALSTAAFSRGTSGAAKSPTKASPARTAGTLLRHSVDDVSYRQTDSTRAADQAQGGDVRPPADAAQHFAGVPGAPSADKQSKYEHLLSAVYTQGPTSKARTSATIPRQASAAAATAGGRQQLPHGAPSLSAAEGPAPPPLRTSSSPKGFTGGLTKSSNTTPVLRRSIRASILDSSQGASLIPASPESVAAIAAATSSSSSSKAATAAPGVTSPTILSRLRSSGGSSLAGVSRILQAKEPMSPVRRSAPAAQHKAQYAFGSRVDAQAAASTASAGAARRRASPMRVIPAPPSGSAGAHAERLSGVGRAAASPQRVPSAARASAPAAASTASMRSASAPRMTSADKAQSRFTQHAAAAAQRSRTPNPAQRAAAAAAAAATAASASSGGSGINAARRLRHSAHASSSESRHVARMRASDSALGAAPNSRLHGFSSTNIGLRSPTKTSSAASSAGPPALRGVSAPGRSVLAAAGTAGRQSAASRATPAAPGASRVKPAAMRVDRLALSLPGAGSIAADAAAAAASQDCAAAVMVPVIKDRYKDLFKHTPAAIAVEEARAAAAAAGGGHGGSGAAAAEHSRGRSVTGVPRLSLGSLTRQHPGEALAAPRGSSQQQQDDHHQQQGAADVASPFLGRISGMAAAAPADGSSLQKQQGSSFGTPQGQHKQEGVALLDLSSVTPVHKSRPAAAAAMRAAGEASPCTPLEAAGSHAEQRGGVGQRTLSDIDLTPCPSATPDDGEDTPSLLLRQQPRTSSSSKGHRADSEEPPSPQLAPRNLCTGMQAVQDSSPAAGHESAPRVPGLNLRGATAEAEGSSQAVAAKGLALPALQLQAAAAAAPAGGYFDSPPRHRRGEPDSPSVARAASQPALKAQVNTVHGSSSSSSVASRLPGRTTAADAGGRPEPAAAGKAAAGAKPRHRVGAAAGSSVLAAAAAAAPGRSKAGLPLVRRSLGAASPSSGTGPGRPLLLEAAGGSQSAKTTPLSSPSKKQGTPVPRLDLTPVLASMAAEQESADAQHHQGLLLLEDAPRPRRLELDDDADEDDVHGTHSGHHQAGGKASSDKGHAGPGSGKARGGSGKSQGPSSSKKGAVPGSKGSQKSSEPPPQESFYVYESVMPAEEQRTYEELRRVLLKAPGGNKHAANLQGIWGCYQDARRNTEAMAFRGHRLLDQVSTEYSSFKRDAEVKMDELQQERDEAREELQLAMVAGSIPATALQLAAKDKQVRELQEENSLLRGQVAEMEKALQMASDYHSATQEAHKAHQVPVHARVIAESATTNILTNLTLEQQMRLQQSEKRMEDMKAALHLACGVLRQTNYMDTHSDLRSQLDPDTLAVLDTIMATEEMEAGLAEAAAMEQQQQMLEEGMYGAGMLEHAAAAVHIEEVHELDAGISAADQLH